MNISKRTNEPENDSTYNKTCVTSKDQFVQPPSMARILVYPYLDSLEAIKTHAISADSDQTAQIRRLI